MNEFPSMPGLDDLPGPPRDPVVGTQADLTGSDMHERLKAWAKVYGSIYILWQGQRPIVVLSDPGMMTGVLRARPRSFRRMATIETVCREMGIHSVFSAEGDEWHAQRKLVQSTFNGACLQRFHPTLLTLVEGLRRRWAAAAAAGAAVDVQNDLMHFSLDVITRFTLGYEIDSGAERGLVHGHLQTILDALFHRVHARQPYWRQDPGEKERELEHALAAVSHHMRQAIARGRARMATGGIERPATYLEALLAAPSEYDDAQLLGNAMIMLLAGEDAVANVMTWMFDVLCRYPSVAEALQGDVDAVLGEATQPTLEQLSQMKYAGAVIDEVCRLWPADESLFMETAIGVTIGGYQLPANTPLFLLIRPSMANSANFSDPQTFSPLRWLRGAGCPSGAHERSAYLPFGSGPRFCPGRGLSYHQAQLVAAMVARHFTVEFAEGDAELREEWGFIMAPRGLRVRFRERDRDQSTAPRSTAS